MAVIIAKGGEEILVDDEDFERLNKHVWTVFESHPGYKRARRYEGKRLIYIHHDVLQIDSRELLDLEVDHDNRKSLDNRKVNLNIVTHAENMANTKFAGKGVGLGFHKGAGKWFAYVDRLGQKRQYVKGYYATKEEALAARERFLNGSNS